MPYNYATPSLNKPVNQWGNGGGLMSGGNSGFMPNFAGTAARAGAAVATEGTSEIIAQVLNLIPSIFQGITGASQLNKARKIEDQNPRPEAVVAPSIEKMTNYAYGQTLAQDVPGGEMYRNEIKGATASGIKAASELGSGAEAYGMLGELVGREQNAFGDLAKMTAQQVQGAKGDYMRSLDIRGGEENRVWDWNQAQPYQMAANIASALRDSGMKNIMSAGKNAFGSAAEFIAPDFNSSILWGEGSKQGAGTYTPEEIAQALKSLKS